MYAAPIWFPNTSPSLIQKLPSFQNSALRIATGCVKITSISITGPRKLKCFLSKITSP